jgi:hypothetical protein
MLLISVFSKFFGVEFIVMYQFFYAPVVFLILSTIRILAIIFLAILYFVPEGFYRRVMSG